MTMKERIMSGKLFTDGCEGMPAERIQAKKRMKAFNETDPENAELRMKMQEEMFGRPTKAWIEPPFYFCYGTHISIGDGTYINFNCNCVAVGNPCRVVREIDENDKKYYYKDRAIDPADLEEEAKLRRQE